MESISWSLLTFLPQHLIPKGTYNKSNMENLRKFECNDAMLKFMLTARSFWGHESSPNLALWRACYTGWLAPLKSLCRQAAHRSSEHCNTTLQVYASHDSQGQCAYPACPKKRFTSPAMQPSWSSKMKVSLSCKAGQEAATWDFRLRTRYQKWNWTYVSNAGLTPLTGTATNI